MVDLACKWTNPTLLGGILSKHTNGLGIGPRAKSSRTKRATGADTISRKGKTFNFTLDATSLDIAAIILARQWRAQSVDAGRTSIRHGVLKANVVPIES